jgi:hypothetical protein
MDQSGPVGYAHTYPENSTSNAPTDAPGGVHSFELEQTISSSSKGSWMGRLPWLRSKRDRDEDTLDYVKPGDSLYYGGQMEGETRPGLGYGVGQEEMPVPDQSKQRPVAYAVGHSPNRDKTSALGALDPYSFQSVASWLTNSKPPRKSFSGDDADSDSLADFDDSEWTKQDSSYGAAIPFGGMIPKNIRRTIESTVIALLVIGLVYLVVATSIRVTEDSTRHSNSTSNGSLNLDDDRYIAYDDRYDTYGSNNDAYSNGDDTYSNQNDDGSGNGSGYSSNQGYGYNSNNDNDNGDDYHNDDDDDDDAYGGRQLL